MRLLDPSAGSPRCPACLSKDLEVEAVSGQATLHTFTVNHQPWYPGLDPPYVIAIVELPEQEGLRLTTGIVGCAPDEVEIGMPLQVTFEQYEDVWLPFFEPAAHERRRDRRATRSSAGIGQSDVGRRLHRDPLDLTLDACLEAIDDAGLTRDDIDGIATYPGQHGHAARASPAPASPTCTTRCG